MLKIRLKRTGRTNDPSFKIVVGESTFSPKSGKHLAYLGSYNPRTKHTVIDADAVTGWIAKGAQLSDTVHNLFLGKGVISGKKRNVLPAFKAPEVKKEPEAPKAEAPQPPEEPKTEESKAEEPTS